MGPSHHFAPALAIIEGTFIGFLGETANAIVLPLLLISLGAVLVAWWTTRNLFGGDAGLLVGAAVSLEWTGVFFGTWHGYSENLVMITFTLTMWAILRALRNDRFLPLAGLFAGFGYLSKASMGWFFLLAGVGGLMWRMLYRGHAVLLNRWYLAAIAIFAVPVLVWSSRNLSLFWDGTLIGPARGMADERGPGEVYVTLRPAAARTLAGRHRRQAADPGRVAARAIRAAPARIRRAATSLEGRGHVRPVAVDRPGLRSRLVLRRAFWVTEQTSLPVGRSRSVTCPGAGPAAVAAGPRRTPRRRSHLDSGSLRSSPRVMAFLMWLLIPGNVVPLAVTSACTTR